MREIVGGRFRLELAFYMSLVPLSTRKRLTSAACKKNATDYGWTKKLNIGEKKKFTCQRVESLRYAGLAILNSRMFSACFILVW